MFKSVIFSALILILNSGQLNPSNERKLSRMAGRIWDEPSLVIEQIRCTDLDDNQADGLFFRVSSEDKVLGYIAGRKITDNYLNYFPLFIFDTTSTLIQAGILEMNTLKGAEITSKAWLKQFRGYRGEKIRYGVEIQAISGATLSGLSMVKEVSYYQKIIAQNRFEPLGIFIR